MVTQDLKSKRLSLQLQSKSKNLQSQETDEPDKMSNAVVKFLQERVTSTQVHGGVKRKRENRNQAECITEDAASERLAAAEEKAHKKKMDAQAKKDQADEKKLKKDEERIKAAHKKMEQAKQKYESD